MLSIRLARAVVETAERAGVPRARFLRMAEVGPERLEATEGRVQRSEFYRMCELALDLSADPALGLHEGEIVTGASFPLVAQLIAHSGTLRQSFETLSQFHKLLGDRPRFQLIEREGSVVVRSLGMGGEPWRVRRFMAEIEMTGISRLLRSVRVGARPDQVSFEHPAPAYRPEYTRIFEGAECFEQPFTELVFDRALMDAPSLYKDEDLYSVVRAQAEQRISRLTQQASYAERMCDFLQQQGAASRTEMHTIARALDLSVRSLRRHLTAEGTSYNTVVNHTLAIVAKRLLSEEQRTIQETAHAMGYSDSGAFHRAFSCNLMRPAKSGAAVAGQFPSLVAQFTPYLLAGDGFAAEASFFVERGYNALICTLRGVGNSEGTWQGAGAAQDFRDAYDLVEWFATQPYADGRVGQYGHSYGGFTSWGAAVEQAPHLRAAAPLQPAGSIYDDVIYPGGIESTPAGDLNAWPTIAELVSLGAVVAQEEYDTYHAHSTFDAYWKERAFVDRHADVKVPLLIVGGWTDQYFRAGTIRLIEATAEHAWGIYGPFPHIMPVALDRDCSFCASDPLPAGVLLAWFDHWLMERADAPIPPKPTFVSYESPIGAGDGWRELSAWIPQDHDIVTYQLGSDGILSEVLGPTGTLKFHEPGEPTETNASLSFATKPLDRDRVLLGYARIDLRAKLTASDANFYVELFASTTSRFLAVSATMTPLPTVAEFSS